MNIKIPSDCFTRGITWAVYLMFIMTIAGVSGWLTPDYYKHSCPNAESIVSAIVRKAIQKEARMAASLLRLHFHDCFVNGCDGSILLDDTPTFTGEKAAPPNLNSVRGFEVIDEIKSALENACPLTVSCADIIALVARDGVVMSGGPCFQPLLGRRDSLTANKTAATLDIPAPTSNISTLAAKFAAVGLSIEDMITLSGSHTLGKARCTSFRDRLFNHADSGLPDPSIQRDFLSSLQALCPVVGHDSKLTVLDVETPTRFDNQYFRNLMSGVGLLNSDQLLFNTPGLSRSLVKYYSSHQEAFFEKYKTALIKMGGLKPSRGMGGEIRRNCRFVN